MKKRQPIEEKDSHSIDEIESDALKLLNDIRALRKKVNDEIKVMRNENKRNN
jgi:hypothetical protein